jgi:hypothetical protein
MDSVARDPFSLRAAQGMSARWVVDELLARGLSVRVLDSLAHGSVPSFFLA